MSLFGCFELEPVMADCLNSSWASSNSISSGSLGEVGTFHFVVLEYEGEVLQSSLLKQASVPVTELAFVALRKFVTFT